MKQLLFIIIFLSNNLHAQYLKNASFEGVSKIGLPEGWLPFGKASSPDTQPSVWNVTTKAAHGNSYITMVCRGYSIIDSYLWEACYQQLATPLTENKTYHYSIDLAHSKNFLASTIPFDKPLNLKIFGWNDANQKELLWESGSVAHSNWETYFFELNPTIRVEYLLLEAYYLNFPKYNGNIMIDNLQYYPTGFPIQNDTLLPIEDQQQENSYQIFSQNETIEKINDRLVQHRKTLKFKNNNITFTVFDNQSFDGDIISLFLNDKCILDNYLLTKEKYSFTLQLDEDKINQLTLYAHNVGEIPPNTVSVIINDGTTQKKITLSSNLKTCSALNVVIM